MATHPCDVGAHRALHPDENLPCYEGMADEKARFAPEISSWIAASRSALLGMTGLKRGRARRLVHSVGNFTHFAPALPLFTAVSMKAMPAKPSVIVGKS